MNLSKLIKSSERYDLTIFSAESIDRVEKNVFEKKHDLNDIAFAFEKWGKENGLSFWR